MNHIRSAILTLLALFLASCGGSSNDAGLQENRPCVASDPTPYVFNLPQHIPAFSVPANNITTVEGVALGKRLYHDSKLSEGGPMNGNSCSTCHIQSKNFSNNASGTSVLPHTNLNWASFYLWEGNKSGSLEDIMEFEIASFFEADVELFNSDPVYRDMNCEAFGRSDINQTDMVYAMAQWMRTLVSSNSKYDQYLAGQVQLTAEEQLGMEVFTSNRGHCFKCHTLPLTTDYAFHNNGLNLIREGLNAGRFNVTGDPVDKGWFKIPSLRNIELTAPYMHDGRFSTLEEVVEFYDRQVVTTDTLDPIFVEQLVGNVYALNLHATEKAGLVAFLKTFTDHDFINNPEFSDPFK